jgi:hypothetical protein
MINRITNRWNCNCGACDVSIDYLNGVQASCRICGDSFIEIKEKNNEEPEYYNTEYINDR